MAVKNIYFTPAPVAVTNLTATLADGGSLAPNTTYYYQIFYTQGYDGLRRLQHGISHRSATVSATTTDTQKTIVLDWDDVPGFTPTTNDYHGFLILKNTADDFSDQVECLVGEGSSTSNPRAVSASTYTDNGTDTGKMKTIHYKQGLPSIYFNGGDSGDPVTMWDIYQADLAGGWGVVHPCLDDTMIEFDENKKAGGSWYLHANLFIGYAGPGTGTYFRHYNGDIICYGNISSSTDAVIYLGIKKNSYNAATNSRVNLMYGFPYIANSTLNGELHFYGVSISFIGEAWQAYAFRAWNSEYKLPMITGSVGSEFYDCDFPPKGSGQDLLGYGDYRNCRFASVSVRSSNLNLVKPVTTDSDALSMRITDYVFAVEPINFTSQRDVMWYTGYHQTIISPTWYRADSDNQMKLHCCYSQTGMPITGTLTVKNSLKLKVVDSAGNPLAGAVVTITDALGNSDIWQDTTATVTEQLDLAETDLNVSDGTKFAVGDYIRAEHCQEILKVTEITGDTLTVDHAQNTTKAMTILTGKKLFKRITSLTTDANGDVTPYYLTQMIINPIATDMTGYRAEDLNLLDAHVTLGHVEVWAKTPHTITISKSGYITKTVKLTMDRKREEVETLEPQVNFITLGGQEVIHNADPTDGQNRDRWVKI